MAVARGGEEGVLEPLAAQQTQEFLAKATPTDAIEREVDGRVDDDAQFCHGECLVDDFLVKLRHTNTTLSKCVTPNTTTFVKLRHTEYNDTVKLRYTNTTTLSNCVTPNTTTLSNCVTPIQRHCQIASHRIQRHCQTASHQYNDTVKLRRNNHFVGLHHTTLSHHI